MVKGKMLSDYISTPSSRVVGVRLSEEEYRVIASRAARRGQNLSDYMRYVLLRRHEK